MSEKGFQGVWADLLPKGVFKKGFWRDGFTRALLNIREARYCRCMLPGEDGCPDFSDVSLVGGFPGNGVEAT